MAVDLSWVDPRVLKLLEAPDPNAELVAGLPPIYRPAEYPVATKQPQEGLSLSDYGAAFGLGIEDLQRAVGGGVETLARGLGLPAPIVGTAEQARINAQEAIKQKLAGASPRLRQVLETDLTDLPISDIPVGVALGGLRSLPSVIPAIVGAAVGGVPAAIMAEVLQSFGSGAAQTAQEIEETPREKLVRDSTRYLQAFNATDPSLPEETRDRLAREALREEAALPGGLASGAGTLLGSLLTGAGAAGLITRPARGFRSGLAKGFAEEAKQEAAQSAIESIGTDLVRGTFTDESAGALDNLLKGAFKSAIEGGVIGGAVGGVVGAPIGVLQRNVPLTPEEISNQQAAQARAAVPSALGQDFWFDLARQARPEGYAVEGGKQRTEYANFIDQLASRFAQEIEARSEIAPVAQEEYENLLQQIAQSEPPIAGLSAEDWVGMSPEERFKILAENRALNEQIAAQRVSPETLRAAVTGFPPPPVPPAPVEPLAELRKLLSGSLAVQPVTTTPEQAELQRALQDTTVEELGEKPEKPVRVLTSDEEKIRQARQRGSRTLRQALGEAEIIKAREERKMQDWLARYGKQQAAPPVSTEGIEVTELPAGEKVNVPYRPGKRAQGTEARLRTEDGLMILTGLNGGKRLTPQVRKAVTQALSGKPLFRDQLAALTDYFKTLKPNTLTEALIGTFINEIGGNIESKNLDTGAERESPAVQRAPTDASIGKPTIEEPAEGTTRLAEAEPETKVKETKDATQEGKQQQGSKPEREGVDAQRTAAETGGGNRAGQGAQGTPAAEEGKKLAPAEKPAAPVEEEFAALDREAEALRSDMDEAEKVAAKAGGTAFEGAAEKTVRRTKDAWQVFETKLDRHVREAENEALRKQFESLRSRLRQLEVLTNKVEKLLYGMPVNAAGVLEVAHAYNNLRLLQERVRNFGTLADAVNTYLEGIKGIERGLTTSNIESTFENYLEAVRQLDKRSSTYRENKERIEQVIGGAVAKLPSKPAEKPAEKGRRTEAQVKAAREQVAEKRLEPNVDAERVEVSDFFGKAELNFDADLVDADPRLARTIATMIRRFFVKSGTSEARDPDKYGNGRTMSESAPAIADETTIGDRVWWRGYFNAEANLSSKDEKTKLAAATVVNQAQAKLAAVEERDASKRVITPERTVLPEPEPIAQARKFIDGLSEGAVSRATVSVLRKASAIAKNLGLEISVSETPSAVISRIKEEIARSDKARTKVTAAPIASPEVRARVQKRIEFWRARLDALDKVDAQRTKTRIKAARALAGTHIDNIVNELARRFELQFDKKPSTRQKRMMMEHLAPYLMYGRAVVVDRGGRKQEIYFDRYGARATALLIAGNRIEFHEDDSNFDSPVFYRKRLDLLPGLRGLSTMRANDVQPIVNELHKKWWALKKAQVRIVPVDTYYDLDARDQWLFENANAQFDGVAAYNPLTKRVVIVADRIADSNEALKVILHEVKGHYGLRAILGDRYYPIMRELYTKNKLIHDLANEHTEFTKDIATATEEALADAAMNENLPRMEGWKQLVAAVRDWLRKFSFGRSLLREFTDNDIRYLLTRASSLVERGELGVPYNVEAQPGVVFSRGSNAITLEGFDTADTVGELNKRVRTITKAVASTITGFAKAKGTMGEKLLRLPPKVVRAMLAASSTHNLSQLFGEMFPGLIQRKDALERRRTTIVNTLNAEFDKYHNTAQQWFSAQKPSVQREFYTLMGESARLNLDPRKPFDKHTWIPSKDRVFLAKQHSVLARQYQRMKSLEHGGMDGAALFDMLEEVNRKRFMQQHVQVLWNFGKGEGLPASVIGENPGIKMNWVERYPELSAALAKVADKYEKDLRDSEYFTYAIEGEKKAHHRAVNPKLAEQFKKDKDAQNKDNFVRQFKDYKQRYERSNQAPYFHLARQGEFFVKFHAKLSIPDAAEKIAKALYDGGVTQFIPTDSIDPINFLMFETPLDWQRAEQLVKRLEADGLVGKVGGGRIIDNLDEFAHAQPRYIQEMVRRLNSDYTGDARTKEELVDAVRRIHIDMLPETSIHKALLHKDGRAGYDIDMWRAYAERMRSSNFYIGSIATLHEVDEVLREMKTRVQWAQGKDLKNAPQGTQRDMERSIGMGLLYEEVLRRHHEQLSPLETPGIDILRATGWNYFLALLPAYLITNLAQPFQFTLADLGSKFGFVSAAKALAANTAFAFSLATKVLKKGYEEYGWRGVLDMVVDPKVFSDLSPAKAKFMVDVFNSGTVNFSQSVEIARVALGRNPNTSTAMKVASLFGYYSEFVNRVTTVGAAYDLMLQKGWATEEDVLKDTARYRSDPSDLRAASTPGMFDRALIFLTDTQLDYRQENVGRAFGRRGFAGPVTPLITQFHQFQFQTLEKINREILKLFSPNERVEAAKFLGGLFTTTTALAGVMGLPFVSIIMAAADAIRGDDDEPADTKVDIRNWLASWMGKDAAEVFARGLPRGIGVDTSYRMGLQDILPFSRFLADKRRLEDSVRSMALETAGAPASAVANMAIGLSQMYNGDFMRGLETFVPAFVKGPVKAYKLGTEGYTDRAGNQLPMEASGWDTFVQTTGFTPAKKSEQSEASFAYKAYNRQIQQRATELRTRMATAIERGDSGKFKELYTEASNFERKTGVMVLSTLPGVLSRRAQERVAGGVSGIQSPLTKLPQTLSMAQFANI